MIRTFYFLPPIQRRQMKMLSASPIFRTSVLDEKIGEKDAAILREDIELVEGVHGELNVNDYLAGKVAPLFFGSAINNFGVKELLETFIRIAPSRNAAKLLQTGRSVPAKKNSAVLFLRYMPTWIPSTGIGLHL